MFQTFSFCCAIIILFSQSHLVLLTQGLGDRQLQRFFFVWTKVVWTCWQNYLSIVFFFFTQGSWEIFNLSSTIGSKVKLRIQIFCLYLLVQFYQFYFWVLCKPYLKKKSKLKYQTGFYVLIIFINYLINKVY